MPKPKKMVVICSDCGEALDVISKFRNSDGALVLSITPCDCWKDDDEDSPWGCEEDDYNK